MEHLTRNANNDRIVYTIKEIKKENNDIIDKKMVELIDRMVNAFTAILSSIISGILLSIIKNEIIIPCGIIGVIFVFWLFLFFLWFVCGKWVLPFFYKLLKKNIVDITPDNKINSVKYFNTEIMQKVAEVNEVIDVIETTKITDCKILNLVTSVYKMQEVVDFFFAKFISEKSEIRKSNNEGSSELLRYLFNEYTVVAVLDTVIHIRDKMVQLLEDKDIKRIQGIELLENDILEMSNKLNKIRNFIKE